MPPPPLGQIGLMNKSNEISPRHLQLIASPLVGTTACQDGGLTQDLLFQLQQFCRISFQ